MLKIKKQKGFTITPAMFILVLLMIAGITFLMYIKNTGTTAVKLEKTQIAKYTAETGLNVFKTELSKLNEVDGDSIVNKWYNAINETNGTWLFSGASDKDLRTAANTSHVSDLVNLKDSLGNIIGKFKLTIDEGNPATGGVDKYGNNLWSNTTDKNVFVNDGVTRLGVKVDGYATNSLGAPLKGGQQSLYAVIDIPNSLGSENRVAWTYKAPANYLLSTNGYEAGNIPKNDKRLTLLSNQTITGPIHTNDRFDFMWNGDFDVTSAANFPYSATKTRYLGANTWDPPSPVISSIYHRSGDSDHKIIIEGMNFSQTAAYNDIRLPPSYSTIIPAANIVPVMNPDYPNVCMRLEVTIPAAVTMSSVVGNLYFKTADSASAIYYPVDFGHLGADVVMTAPTPVPAVDNPPIEVLGIMQINQPGSLPLPHDKIYKPSDDYNLASYDDPSTTKKSPPAAPGTPLYDNIPYIDWSPAGDEPTGGDTYSITYITSKNMPHKRINVYGDLTYSGSFPKMYYIHNHKAPGTSYYPWTATHSHYGEIFGMPGVNLMEANKPNDYFVPVSGFYDWNTQHRHEITPDLLTNNFSTMGITDWFFSWHASKPTVSAAKINPLLYPNNYNYYSQREYANQVLKSTQGRSLGRNGSDQLDALNTKFSDDRQNGYYDATVSGNKVDFRSVYFGNDLYYTKGPSAGSPVLGTGELSPKVIYVNDNKLSTDYMGIASTAIDSNYKSYRYIEIPKNAPSVSRDSNGIEHVIDGGVIFVREGYVWIGGGTYKGNVSGTTYMYGSNIFGSNTIIDGRLSIISYSEKQPVDPTDYNTDNPGDIIITGNIIYRNKIFPYKEQFLDQTFDFSKYMGFVQYPAEVATPSSVTPSPPYTVTFPSPAITNIDGTIVPNLSIPLKVDNLGLFAFNDIKIPVEQYYQPSGRENHYTDPATEEKNLKSDGTSNGTTDCPCKDTLEIHGELIAAHKITQTKISNDVTSKNDRLVMYGTFYSYYPPNLSYFDGTDPSKPYEESTARLYLFDKSLSDTPLTGAPSFPKDSSYTTTSQVVAGIDLPRIVPGTFKSVPSD